MADQTCDVFIIGAGQAAEQIVEECCGKGMRVVVAERRQVGGSCVNFGCTPSKAVISSAKVAHLARRASEFGLSIPTVDANFPRVLSQARDLVAESRQGVTKRFEGAPHGTLVRGHARLAGREGDRYAVEVNGERWLATYVVLDVGTRSHMPKLEGLDAITPMTAENWIDGDALPRRLALLGGGYISVEMSQFYRRMGAEEVTVIDSGEQILAHEDAEVAEAVQKALEDEGVRFRLKTKFAKVEATATGIRLSGDGEPIEADALFVATGRLPNTGDLGLDTVGVEPDEKGIIPVDEKLHTSARNVFVTGDARGGPMFTHTAWDDARIVLSTIVEPNGHTTDRVVPYAVFVDPQLGRVGMSEREAKEAGKRYRALHFDMASNAHASEARETKGFIKLLVEEDTDQILGAAVLAAEGADLVHLYSLLMVAKAPASVLREAVITHPTYSEAIQNILLD